MRALITAGATRNPIDAMRYISAYSTGRTGVQLARLLADAGVEVTLLGSAEARLHGSSLPGETFGSTRDLMHKMEAWIRINPEGAVIHAAAVGDYEVAAPRHSKASSGKAEWVLALTPTPKIANLVRSWGSRGFFVTFKAAGPETTDQALLELAKEQRSRTASDAVFANVIGRLSKGIAWVTDRRQSFDDRDDAISHCASEVLRALRTSTLTPAS